MWKYVLLISSLIISSSANATTFYPTQGVSIPSSASNQLGMAVDQNSGHFFVTSLSYGGEDNLYEYDPTGSLVRSSRVELGIIHQDGPGLTSLVVGSNGHLYVRSRNDIYEISQDGQTVYSSTTIENGYDLAYDYNTDEIIISNQGSDNAYLSSAYGVSRFDLSGNLINSSDDLNNFGDRDPQGLAYNSNNDHLFSAYNARIDGVFSSFMVEYEWDAQGLIYNELAIYDLSAILHGVNTLEYDNATDLLYLGNNAGIYGFSLEEVPQISTVPLPAAVWLFGSGLIGLAGLARRKKA